MSDQQNYFKDLNELKAYVKDKEESFLLITHRNCEDYEGMVLCIILRVDSKKDKYTLQLEWMSFGLDFYGDTLMESYWYQFDTLEALTEYLLLKYGISISDIPYKYNIDLQQYPNPLKDEAKKPIFEKDWQRFGEDFKKGIFLDKSLKLVYSS